MPKFWAVLLCCSVLFIGHTATGVPAVFALADDVTCSTPDASYVVLRVDDDVPLADADAFVSTLTDLLEVHDITPVFVDDFCPIDAPGRAVATISLQQSAEGDEWMIIAAGPMVVPIYEINRWLEEPPVTSVHSDQPHRYALPASYIMYGLAACDGLVALAEDNSAVSDFWRQLRSALAGDCLLYRGEVDEALSWYQAEDTNRFGIFNHAWALFQAGAQDQAIDLITAAVEQAEGREIRLLTRYVQRAHLLMSASRFDDAVADLDAALELRPNLANIYVLRGRAYLGLYEWDKSLADYDAALALNPDYAEAYFHRGVLYYSILQTGLDTRADALADFETYLERAPDGEYAEAAAAYADSIREELEALNAK